MRLQRVYNGNGKFRGKRNRNGLDAGYAREARVHKTGTQVLWANPSPYLVFRARWQTPARILRPLTPFAAPTVLGPAGQHCRWYECIDAGPHRVRGCMRGRLMCLPRGCMGRARELTKHHVSLDTCDVTWLRARPIGGIHDSPPTGGPPTLLPMIELVGRHDRTR